MRMKRKLSKRLVKQSVSANRRKRMLANNKKKVIMRTRAYASLAE
ncbi:hypothetical protein [Vibrio ulleungensis]|jgi:hypothetical protein|nr:hypothetical protein [Vibrio ulleungensis]